MADDVRVVHLICSDGFSGVERHVIRLATAQAAAGARPVVIGGQGDAMRAGLSDADVEWRPGASIREVAAAAASIANADIYHTHMTASDVAGVVASLRRPRPVVSTRHFASRRGSSVPTRFAMAAVAPRITAQIAISEFVARSVEGTSTVVYAGVENDAFVDGPREKEVLVAQRLQPEKRTSMVIDAWARLRPSGWTLRILGRGPERVVLEDLVREYGLEECVAFEGFTPQIRDRLRSASIVVATAPLEPYGLTVVEAMAAGTPVLAAGAAGHLETVGRVSDKGLFRPGDSASLASGLESMIADEAEREQYGAALRQHQRTHLTLEQQHLGTMKVYERVLA